MCIVYVYMLYVHRLSRDIYVTYNYVYLSGEVKWRLRGADYFSLYTLVYSEAFSGLALKDISEEESS